MLGAARGPWRGAVSEVWPLQFTSGPAAEVPFVNKFYIKIRSSRPFSQINKPGGGGARAFRGEAWSRGGGGAVPGLQPQEVTQGHVRLQGALSVLQLRSRFSQHL